MAKTKDKTIPAKEPTNKQPKAPDLPEAVAVTDFAVLCMAIGLDPDLFIERISPRH